MKTPGILLGIALATPALAVTDNQRVHDISLRMRDSLVTILPHVGGELSCTDARLKIPEGIAEDLRRSSANDWALTQNRTTMDAVRYLAAQRLEDNAPITLQASFMLADRYLAVGCLDRADAQYRAILATFSGPAWSGEQQRAAVGIEDVRRARQPSGAAQGK
jgi:hypothetical protein